MSHMPKNEKAFYSLSIKFLGYFGSISFWKALNDFISTHKWWRLSALHSSETEKNLDSFILSCIDSYNNGKLWKWSGVGAKVRVLSIPAVKLISNMTLAWDQFCKWTKVPEFSPKAKFGYLPNYLLFKFRRCQIHWSIIAEGSGQSSSAW